MERSEQISAVMAKFEAALSAAGPAAAKAADQPVVGYFCSYVPMELLLAAGLYPLRLRGLAAEDSATGDAYLSHLTCSFARHVTAAVLDGKYSFLSGQISLNTCDHVRRANDAIVAKSDLGFHGYLSVPRSFRESLFSWYQEELSRLRSALAEHFQREITDQALREAMARINQARERLSRLDQLRRENPPRLSGTEMHTVAVAARLLLPEAFVELADELIAACEKSEPLSGLKARVLLIGGELDDPRFIRVIESQGAHVVGDLLCWGSRGLGQKVEPGAEPLADLGRAYLYQIPCARMMGEFPHRYSALLQLYDQAQAQGVIFQRIKFCQIWSNEVHNLRHRFATEPKPFLVLDREYGTISTGQIKTRVQAFVESIAGRNRS